MDKISDLWEFKKKTLLIKKDEIMLLSISWICITSYIDCLKNISSIIILRLDIFILFVYIQLKSLI